MPGLNVAGVVLAAGAGTRLRPLTELLPKALCPVGNVPLVDHALARVLPVATEVAVNVHHHRRALEAHLAGRVHLSIEQPAPLGTAGALGRLRSWIDGRPALVVNGDAWTRAPLGALLDGWDGARIRLLVVEDPTRADFDRRRRFAGASLIPWNIIRSLEAEHAGLYEMVWRPAIDRGEVELVETRDEFIDCGTPTDYHRANMVFSRGENVVARDAIVHGRIERCVVWPRAIVSSEETLHDCIRATAGVTVQV